MPESTVSPEAGIETRFKCCSRQLVPTALKGVHVGQEEYNLLLSHTAYNANKGNFNDPPLALTKSNLCHEPNNDEPSQHRTAAGRSPGLITTKTLSTSACLVSMVFQGSTKTVALKQSCCRANARVPLDNPAKICNSPLDMAPCTFKFPLMGRFKDYLTSTGSLTSSSCLKTGKINLNCTTGTAAERLDDLHPQKNPSSLSSSLRSFVCASNVTSCFSCCRKRYPSLCTSTTRHCGRI